jgi:hypothetical protein
MLLHLPIAFLATLSPIPVSNTVPTFDIVRECRFATLPGEDAFRPEGEGNCKLVANK